MLPSRLSSYCNPSHELSYGRELSQPPDDKSELHAVDWQQLGTVIFGVV